MANDTNRDDMFSQLCANLTLEQRKELALFMVQREMDTEKAHKLSALVTQDFQAKATALSQGIAEKVKDFNSTTQVGSLKVNGGVRSLDGSVYLEISEKKLKVF